MSSSPPKYEVTEYGKSVEGEKSNATRDTFSSNEQNPQNQVDGSDEEVPPPAYGDIYGELDEDRNGVATRAVVADDGRVNIRINQKTKGLSSLLVPALRSQLDLAKSRAEPPYIPPGLGSEPGQLPPPPLNVVIHVVGSRGDVQPFIALGKVLKEKHGHRVRLATHPVFKDFVEENGIEFFNIAGDPSELMAFMVKNPGLMPGFDTLRRGDIGKRRKEIGNMITRCWRSCIESGDGFGPEATDDTVEDVSAKPFIADAIIANPPSFAHIHCAEKLGIPLHMMFTMPWSPTQSFPHPLANITSSNADVNMTNFLSYALVDMMTWQGLGDVINRFRQKSLGLEPVSLMWAPGMLARLKVPWTYCWSPTLIPKPRDWGAHIAISGFYFLSLGSSFTPEPDLAAFLEAGPPPVYIGFGSIVVDDPNAMTKLIFDAVEKSGQRALVSKGWGGFGADQIGIPDGVFMLGNVPHDWLFKHVSCVVHHGGAGTTAAGIACGKPTVVIPFFGDQAFWGAMLARAGAGPKPVPYKELTADQLAASIKEALQPKIVEKAKQMAESIKHENGSDTGANDFHAKLDVDKLRCRLVPNRVAVWRLKRTEVRLSAFAATVLGNEGLIKFGDLKLYRSCEHDVEDEPWDPITGATSALVGTMGSMAMGIADMPVQTLKALKIHPDAVRSLSPSARAKKTAEREAQGAGTPSRTSSNSLSHYLSPDGASRSRGTSPGAGSTHSSRSSSPDNSGPAVAAAVGNAMASAAANQSSNESDDGSAKSTYDVESALGSSISSSSNNQGKKKSALANAPVPFDMESAMETGKGIFRFAGAGIKSPMDFTLGLARGFHNAPKLYGDESVRKSEKITDFQSGIRAATKEFGYGFYDGITGLVTQPMEGVKKEGAAGFFKGFAKGIGGVVLKPGAAIWGIPGYTSKGIYRELQKMFGPSVENYIIASRTAQGYEDVQKSSAAERAAVVRTWKEMRPYIRKKKSFGREQMEQLQAKHEELKKKGKKVDVGVDTASNNRIERSSTIDSEIYSPEGGSNDFDMIPLDHIDADKQPGQHRKVAHDDDEHAPHEDHDLEEAIRRSVAETSRGNSDEDALIERAIRASMTELQTSSRHHLADDDEAMQQAVQASIEEARTTYRSEHEAGFADAYASSSSAAAPPSYAAADQSEKGNVVTTERELELEDVTPEEDDAHLDMALRESREAHERTQKEEEEARQEEEVVMRYMMKQSLAEEEARKKRMGQ